MNEYIQKTNESLDTATRMKASLHKNNFYTEERLKQICENIQGASGIGSYVSSYAIWNSDPAIKLNLRKSFFKRFGKDMNNSLEFYNHLNKSIKQCYIDNHLELEECYPKILRQINMMYDIARIDDNALYIKF